MDRNLLLSNRLREVYIDGKWIANTNYKEQLALVDWEQAVKSVNSLNSIAALTFHINYYLKGLLNVFNGGKLEISDKYSFDLPEISTEAQWNELTTEFLNNAGLFIEAVKAIPDERFDQPFVDEKYGTYLRNIEGVIEHSYYHLGQISIINKMLGQMHS